MPEFDPRRATPGEVFGFTARSGEQREIKTDDEGVVRPKDAEEAAILDGFDLPVARKAIAEEEAKAEAKPSKKAADADDGGNA